MKLCIECKHAKSVPSGMNTRVWFCHHPELLWRPMTNPVTGVVSEPKPLTCDENRHGHRCGLAATHWETKR